MRDSAESQKQLRAEETIVHLFSGEGPKMGLTPQETVDLADHILQVLIAHNIKATAKA